MNVNRLYVAQIYIITKKEEDEGFVYTEGEFVKQAIVYHYRNNKYIDLISDEIYKIQAQNAKVGEMIINLQLGLIPVNENVDVKFDRTNMCKKRILKNLSNSKLLNEEDDE